MERILVFSDTHGSIDGAEKAFDSIAGVTGVIHLGDYTTDADRLSEHIAPVPFYNIAGNNDFFTDLPMEKVIEIAGKKIFLCHGHQYVRGYTDMSQLIEKSVELKADIALFGHTHIPFNEKIDGILYANPGSISWPRSTERSYGILEIDGDKIGYSNIFIDFSGNIIK